jgi:hypothetical protein
MHDDHHAAASADVDLAQDLNVSSRVKELLLSRPARFV